MALRSAEIKVRGDCDMLVNGRLLEVEGSAIESEHSTSTAKKFP